ncbi:MAG: hypothetical protein GX153_10300, partial [Clostridiaceae bacterium]|nr:hypothetical protein [Clostridiaceae bacterium]
MKVRTILPVLLLLFVLAACTQTPKESTDQTTATITTTAPETMATPVATSTTAVSTTPVVTTTTAAVTTTTAAATTLATTATSVTVSTSASQDALQSGYAHMISYDPARGWADFDFFNMLRGDSAVAWLVAHEGLSEADAQILVDDFADSE